jgi:hypothetical protein
MLALWLSLSLSAPPPIPSDAECPALPSLATSRFPFQAGEKLDYEIDMLGGIKLGTVEMEVDAPEHVGGDLVLPIRAHAQGDGFIASIGKLKSDAKSWVRIHDLHPTRYREDYTERAGAYWTDVQFPAPGQPCKVHFSFGQPGGVGERTVACGSDVLDVLGSFYFARGLDLQIGQPLCFDLYGSRHVWRVWGTVAGRETKKTPAGKFDTLRLTGHAGWIGPKDDRKDEVIDLSVWLTDDARHLPVASVAGFGFGPIRAAITGMGGAHRTENDR